MAKAGNHGRIIPRNKALLRRLYWKENHTLPEIGQMFGVTHKSVERVFRQLGIPRRKAGHSRKFICKCGAPVQKKQHPGNGSFYGTKCKECRRKHYNGLAREYAKRPDVAAYRKDYMGRWYLIGAKNPTGELQWLNRSKALLRNTRRLFLKPRNLAACELRNKASELVLSLQT